MKPKSLISIMAVVAMLIGLGVSPSQASPVIRSTKGLDYLVLEDGTVSIVHCTGWRSGIRAACPKTSYVIPASIDGKSVTDIAEDAFASGGLTSITLPSSLLTVGKRAFRGNKIKNLVLPNNLQVINERAFEISSYSKSELLKLKPKLFVPASVTFVGFRSLPKVYEIHFLGDAPTSNVNDVFDNMSVAPTMLSAFYTKSGWSDFSGMYVRPKAPAGTKTYKGLYYQVTRDGTITITYCQMDSSGVPQCPLDLNIPSKIEGKAVTRIGDNAFSGGSVFTATLPESLISIGKNAFSGTYISNIKFPGKLQSIGAEAFNHSPRTGPWLRNVITIPASVTYIGSKALIGLGETPELHFLGNAPSIDVDNIFDTNLPLGIYAKARKTGWSSRTFSGQPVTLDTDAPSKLPYGSQNGLEWKLKDDGTVEITSCSGWTNRDYLNKSPCPKKSYVFPETIRGRDVTSIGKMAFAYASLTTIKLPSKLVSIGDEAFINHYADTKVKTLILPRGLKTIGSGALSGIRVDSLLNIPASVTSIGESSLPVAREINFLGDAPALVKDPYSSSPNPFTYRRSRQEEQGEEEYITALASKSGWKTRSYSGTRVVLDTDIRPKLPKVRSMVLRQICSMPLDYVVIAVQQVKGVTFQVKVTKNMGSWNDVSFGEPGRAKIPSNFCLPMSKFKTPAGSILFAQMLGSPLSFSVVPISNDGTRGPEYRIPVNGGAPAAGGSGGN